MTNTNKIDLSKLAGLTRLDIAEKVPFVLRAWWLRDFQEGADIFWPPKSTVTGPIWSYYSDPLCDVAGLDDVDEI